MNSLSNNTSKSYTTDANYNNLTDNNTYKNKNKELITNNINDDKSRNTNLDNLNTRVNSFLTTNNTNIPLKISNSQYNKTFLQSNINKKIIIKRDVSSKKFNNAIIKNKLKVSYIKNNKSYIKKSYLDVNGEYENNINNYNIIAYDRNKSVSTILKTRNQCEDKHIPLTNLNNLTISRSNKSFFKTNLSTIKDECQNNYKKLEKIINNIKEDGFNKVKTDIDSKNYIRSELQDKVNYLNSELNFYNFQIKKYGAKNTIFEENTLLANNTKNVIYN